MAMEGEKQEQQIYHEKQKLQFCLLHALNNLFQEKDCFTRDELDSIASKLILDDGVGKPRWTPLSLIFAPHHNKLTGNYDVNVLIGALESRGRKVVWHDRRSGASTIDLDRSDESLAGIMLNVATKKFAGLWRSRHWIALRRIDGIWYNLDSDLDKPKSFQNVDEVTDFMDDAISCGGEILLVLNENQ